MALIVQKFGGTSVADVPRIQKVARIILKEYADNHKLVIVVSAMAGVTNSLISNCSEVSQLNSYDHMQEYDAVVGSGEILTSGLLALELQKLGAKAKSVQAWQIPILTDDVFANAKVESINSEFIHNLLKNGIIPVITGFQGVTVNKQITTLGKGGSDTTAALIAAAIGADRVDIYTDVLGVFTADPRIVHEASKIDHISTDQMLILSSYGAKVLHPRAALAAARYKFDMRVLSSFEDDPGTLISSKNFDKRFTMENRLITAITSNKNIIQIEIICTPNSFVEVIKKFTEESLVVDKIEICDSNKIVLVAALADKNKFEVILDSLKSISKILIYDIKSNISTVTAVGYGIKNDNGICFNIIDLLNKQQIKIKEIDVTETSFTATLEDQDTEKAIKLLHKHFRI
ncbi:MAG: aspartate kinase [Rickettsiaceae bacterium]